jgi:hypothetical protein
MVPSTKKTPVMRKITPQACLCLLFLLLSTAIMAQRTATRRTSTHRNTVITKSIDSTGNDEQFISIEAKEINSPKCDAYPWISVDGLRLYFTSNRDGGHGNIYCTERRSTDESFSKPVKVFPQLSNKYYAAVLSPDELTMILTLEGYTLLIAERTTRKGKFSDPRPITDLKGLRLYAPSISPDGKELMALNMSGEIMHFEKAANGHFIKKGKLNIPPGSSAAPGQFGKDGLAYYCSLKDTSHGSDKLHYFTRPNSSSAFIYAGPLPGLGKISNNIQPSVNGDGTIIAYCKNEYQLWDENNIYVAKLAQQISVEKTAELPAITKMPKPQVEKIETATTVLTSAVLQTGLSRAVMVAEPQQLTAAIPAAKTVPVTMAPAAITIYPNPFTNQFAVVCNEAISGKMLLEIFDATGRSMFTKDIPGNTTQIRDINLPAGKYLCRITMSKKLIYSGILISLK